VGEKEPLFRTIAPFTVGKRGKAPCKEEGKRKKSRAGQAELTGREGREKTLSTARERGFQSVKEKGGGGVEREDLTRKKRKSSAARDDLAEKEGGGIGGGITRTSEWALQMTPRKKKGGPRPLGGGEGGKPKTRERVRGLSYSRPEGGGERDEMDQKGRLLLNAGREGRESGSAARKDRFSQENPRTEKEIYKEAVRGAKRERVAETTIERKKRGKKGKSHPEKQSLSL